VNNAVDALQTKKALIQDKPKIEGGYTVFTYALAPAKPAPVKPEPKATTAAPDASPADVAPAPVIEREDHGDFGPNALERISEQIAVRKFDTHDSDQRALLRVVDAIFASMSPIETQTIQYKSALMLLLERMEHCDLFNRDDRALLSYLRLFVEQIEPADDQL
jgi:hypothetical protein